MPTNKNKTPARKSIVSKSNKNPRQDDGLVTGSVLRNSGAQIRMMKDSCRIHHREMVGFVDASTANGGEPRLQWFSMNPSAFPWLKVQSRGWEQYRYHDIRIHFEPTCAATAAGVVALFPDMDDEDNDPTTISQVMAMNNAVSGPVFRRSTSAASAMALKIAPTRYVAEADEGTVDSRWTNVGWFGVWSEGCTTSIPGQVHIEYDVTLFIQQSPRGVEPNSRDTGLIGPVINRAVGEGLKKLSELGNDILEATNPTTDDGTTSDPKGFRVAGSRFGWASVVEKTTTALGVSLYEMFLKKYLSPMVMKLTDLSTMKNRMNAKTDVGLDYVDTTISNCSALAFDMGTIATTVSINRSDAWKHCGLLFSVGRLGESDVPATRILSLHAEGSYEGGALSGPTNWSVGDNQHSTATLSWSLHIDPTTHGIISTATGSVDYTLPAGVTKIIKMVIQRVVTTNSDEGYTIDFYLGRDWEALNSVAGWRLSCFAIGSSSSLDSSIEFSINAFGSEFDAIRTRQQSVRHTPIDRRTLRSPKKFPTN